MRKSNIIIGLLHITLSKFFTQCLHSKGMVRNGWIHNSANVFNPRTLTDCHSSFRMMAKRAQGRKSFFRQNSFKQRYFRLTTQSLSYSKSKGQKPTCDIPLSDILAVERLHERSFKLQNIFQVSAELELGHQIVEAAIVFCCFCYYWSFTLLYAIINRYMACALLWLLVAKI